MRLTLRALLAYMHGLLPAEDAELMGKKIEESEVASNLMHRIQDVGRRLRLGAPDVKDSKGGLDPNTVAEYLDHVLRPEQVADFEKVCLESDMHLAEVAACHQILALVLRQAAEIDPASRQRMYELGTSPPETRVDAALPAEPAATASAQAAADSDSESEGSRHVESATAGRAGRPRRWSTLALAAVLLVVGGVGLLTVTGQVNLRDTLIRWLGSSPPATISRASEQPSVPSTPDRQTTPAAPATADGAASAQRPSGAPAGETGQEGTSEPSPGTGVDTAGEPDATVPGTTPGTVGADSSVPEGRPAELAQPLAAVQSPDRLPPGASPERAEPASPEPMPADDERPPQAETATVDGGPARDEAGSGLTPAPQAPLPREPVGQLTSPGEILLWFDSGASGWRRLPETEPVRSKTTYLSLPAFRPVVQLSNRMELHLVDAAKLQILPTDEQGVAGLGLEFGALVIRLSGNLPGNAEEQQGPPAPAKLYLRVADQTGVIHFEDQPCVVGIEASRTVPPGLDPETAPGIARLYLYVAAGKVLWGTSDQAELALTAPMRVALMQRPLEAEVMDNLPDWMAADTLPLLDLQAKTVLDRTLVANRPVVLGLRELAEHRRREVSWLAMRALETMGDFEPLVAALDDPANRAMWPDYIDRLRTAVWRSPLSAGQVRAAMENLFGPDGTYLYEMLWKYHPENFDLAAATTLVDFLEHKRLAIRVVAFATLRRLSGLGFYYRPEDLPIERQGPVRKWREWLRTNPAFQDNTTSSPALIQGSSNGWLVPPLGVQEWPFGSG